MAWHADTVISHARGGRGGGAKVAETCQLPAGRPFEIRAALTLAAVVSAIMFVSAILLAVFGVAALWIGTVAVPR